MTRNLRETKPWNWSREKHCPTFVLSPVSIAQRKRNKVRDFLGDLVLENSMANARLTEYLGGYLGSKTKGTLNAEFVKVAWALEHSVESIVRPGIAKTEYGYHVIVVTAPKSR